MRILKTILGAATAVVVCFCAYSSRAQSTNVLNGLVLWLPLTNSTDVTLTDESGNGNTATLGNFPTIGFPEWVPGVDGNALYFNNPTNVTPFTNEFVYVPDAPDLNFTNANTLQFSLACWFNCTGGTAGAVNAEVSGACLIDKGVRQGALGGQQYTIDFNAGYIRFYGASSNGTTFPAASGGSTNNPGNQAGVPTPFKPVYGSWYHLVCTYSGQSSNLQMSVYINGVVTNSGVSGKILQSLQVSTNGVNIGNRNNTAGVTNFNAPFKGLIADVRIYNRVLTASEVTNIYGLGFQPPTITQRPASLSRYVGDPVELTVGANSSVPATFQWRLNGTNVTNAAGITGATGQALVINSLTLAEAGSYTVVVSNAYGKATSAPGVLTIRPLPAPDTNTAEVAYWNLNENSGGIANDSNPNDPGDVNTANIYGATWDIGILGSALLFGQNTVAAAPDIDTSDNGVYDFSSNASFTLSCWVKGTNVQVSGSCLLAKGTGGGGEEYTMDTAGNVYRFYVRDAGGTSWLLGTTVSPNNAWQNLTCVFDATNQIMDYYVNAQLVAWMLPPPSMLSNQHELSFGCRQSSTGAYNDYWNGDIDEIHIYSRALNAADVQALYAGALSPPVIQTQPKSISRYVNDPAVFTEAVTPTTLGPFTYQWFLDGAAVSSATNSYLIITNVQASNAGSYAIVISNPAGSVTSAPPAILSVNNMPAANLTGNLVAWYKFDETSGYSFADSSGNNNNGTLNGFANDPAEWVPGVLNNALQFNADASGADVAAIPGVGQGDNGVFDFSVNPAFTLACWVKSIGTVPPNSAAIIAKGTGSGGEQFGLDEYDLTYRMFLRDQNGNAYAVQYTAPVSGAWQHVAAVFDGTNSLINLYVNGQVTGFDVNTYNGLPVGPTLPPTTLLPSQHEVSVGNRQSSAVSTYNLPWTGVIDDVHIYNRALTYADIQALITSGSGPVTAGTVSFSALGSQLLTNGMVQFSGSASGGGAASGASYRVWETHDVTLPFSAWTPVATNTFGATGTFTFDIPNPGTNSAFFKVTVP